MDRERPRLAKDKRLWQTDRKPAVFLWLALYPVWVTDVTLYGWHCVRIKITKRHRSERTQGCTLTELCNNARLSISCCYKALGKPGKANNIVLFFCFGMLMLYGGGSGHADVCGCTFHCRVRVFLVRCESFGGKGTSGTLDSVVNEPASEQEPRTKL